MLWFILQVHAVGENERRIFRTESDDIGQINFLLDFSGEEIQVSND